MSHDELEIEHVVDASLPTGEQARLLDMRADEPCLTLTRRTWTNGQPVTFVHFLHPGNRYRLGSRFAGRRTPPDLIPFPMDSTRRPFRQETAAAFVMYSGPRQIARACPASRDHTTGNSG